MARRRKLKRSNQIKKEIPKLHPEANRVYKIIKSHDAITGEINHPEPLDDGGFRVRFELEVVLPTKARKAGITKTGVKLKEPVIFRFPPSYPYKAPKILLRPDFNRCLPHIYPTDINDNGCVNPCVYNGSLDELLHMSGNGLSEIINHLSEWLSKAAIDDLIDPDQGWEPIRRDETYGWIVYDLAEMRGLIKDTEGAIAFRCYYCEYPIIRRYYFVWGIETSNPINITPNLIKNIQRKSNTDFGPLYESLVFISWANQYENSNEKYLGQYFPETIENLQQLLRRAEEYGCDKPLKDLLVQFRWAYWEARTKQNVVSAFIILCVKRPYNIIDDDSPLELIPYKVDFQFNNNISWSKSCVPEINHNSHVEPLGHRYALNNRLLQRMSGVNKVKTIGTIVHLGCGSVGSKVCLHLVRSGCGPFHLIDKGVFSPHNAARHALTGNMELPCFPKAYLLAEQIKLFRQKATYEITDFIQKSINSRNGENTIFPEDAALIIETTGSIAVREMLSSLKPEQVPGRLLHAGLYDEGKAGFLAIEGPYRNPNLNDLAVSFWDQKIDDERLNSVLNENMSFAERQIVGLGCSSHTMVMPDTRISIFSAAVGERARQILSNGPPNNGELWIGLLDSYGVGVQWQRIDIGRTVVIKDGSKSNWEVRLTEKAVNQINTEAIKWNNIETGGVLIGKISVTNRCITITRVCEAPQDSERSENSFILGIEGLRKNVLEIRKKSGKTLTYVGTWHSHPKGGAASSIDKNSLQKINQLRFGFPTVGLIWTPNGFTAIINEGTR
jgi:integrative and conjugative element protein (TIGR02256 family)